MNWNHWIRQIHRWPSMAFMVAVIINIVANMVASGREDRALWVGALALVPLALLLLTGLYLFALPHASQWRGGRRGTEEERPSERQAT